MIWLDLKTVNEGNTRSRWRDRARRAKHQRLFARSRTALAVKGVKLPIVVHMCRVGARKLDSDGVPSALKAVRDGIADALGIDDGRDDLITWEYSQEYGAGLTHGVRVTIESRTEDPCTQQQTTIRSARSSVLRPASKRRSKPDER